MNKNDFEGENTNTNMQNEEQNQEQNQEHSHRRKSNRDVFENVVHWLDKNRVSFIWIFTSLVMGIIFVALTIFTIISVSSNAKNTNVLIADNFNLQAKINDYDGKIQMENDKSLSAMLIRLLPEDRLVSLTKNNWLYKITINGATVKENTFDVYTPNINITISETELESENKFPLEINAKGSITTGEENVSYTDFITVSGTTVKPIIESKIEGNTKSTTYKFINLKVGDITNISLDAELATRIGLSDPIIEIFFPKNNGGK